MTVRLPAKEIALNILKADCPHWPIKGSFEKELYKASLQGGASGQVY